jgi:hypothetical protein
MIKDKGIRETMEADDMIKEHACELQSIGRFIARDNMAHLGKAVDEDKEGVVAIGDREISDEVPGDSFPWAWRYSETH